MITTDARCHREITNRIAIGKETFSTRKELLSGKLNRNLNKRLKWSVVLFRTKIWTMRRAEIRRLGFQNVDMEKNGENQLDRT